MEKTFLSIIIFFPQAIVLILSQLLRSLLMFQTFKDFMASSELKKKIDFFWFFCYEHNTIGLTFINRTVLKYKYNFFCTFIHNLKKRHIFVTDLRLT